MSIEAMKQALDALELYQAKSSVQMFDDAAKFLRQAIEQAEKQEPVLWLKTWSDGSVSVLKTKSHAFADRELEPLYSAPPPRKPLTDEHILLIANRLWEIDIPSDSSLWFARAIEAAHGIGDAA